MNIDKAIEIKEAYYKRFSKHMLSSERRADRLSIEALKWRQHCEAVGYVETCDPLPGETKE